MPLPGNRLGSKTKYLYESDGGSTYVLKIDPDLAVTGSGLVAGTAGSTVPKRFKPRGVYVQASVPAVTTPGSEAPATVARKFLIAGTVDAALYATNTPQVVTIDGLAFTTTGRRGEKQSFT